MGQAYTSDIADTFTVTYLGRVLDIMDASPEEDARIRALAREAMARRHAAGFASESYLRRWSALLDQRVQTLREVLLPHTHQARNMRYAHIFAGLIPEEEDRALTGLDHVAA